MKLFTNGLLSRYTSLSTWRFAHGKKGVENAKTFIDGGVGIFKCGWNGQGMAVVLIPVDGGGLDACKPLVPCTGMGGI